MRGVARNDTRRNPNHINRRCNRVGHDSVELVMAVPAQITADYGSVWRYKTIPDAKYRFLYQIGSSVFYRALTSDDSREPFEIDVTRWLENYVQIDN